mmetsp:Transcript_36911/g.80800  ORF Transcript_36911/g.80800 Transcript_36911/m.80800 type:complete len:267 (-) Transcript_36911:450-1250(-)
MLDKTGTGHYHGMNAFGDLPAHGNGGDVANVFDAAVGAGSDEHLLDGDALDVLPTLETNVLEGTLDGGLSCGTVIGSINLGYLTGNWHGILRRRTPRNGRCNVGGINNDRLIVDCTIIGLERVPVLDCGIPLGPGGTHGPSLEVFVGRFVGCDDARTGTGLDGHVGDGHPSLHGERGDGIAGEFNGGAGSASGPDNTTNMKNDILTGNSLPQPPIHPNQHIPSLDLAQGLSRQNMFHLTRTNPKRHGPKRTVSSRVRISADAHGSR